MNAPVIHLVDDDVPFLRAISRMLRALGYQVSLHDSAAEFLASATDAAGCVVADLEMPEMDGLALQDALEARGSALPVVFLTGHGDIPTTVRAMRGGAEDFLTKLAPQRELLAAIDRALLRNARARSEHSRLTSLRKRFDALSPRERQVLAQVVRGRLNKQIAADLGIHERTVKLHRTAITTKLGIHSAAELAVLAREAGLFEESRGPTCPKGQ